MTLKDIQKEIVANKKRRGFNTTNIEQEFCYLYVEIGEAYEAYYNTPDNFPEELADVAIFLLGIAEINGIDIEDEILKAKNLEKEINIGNIENEFCSLYGMVRKAYEAYIKKPNTFPTKLAEISIFLLKFAEVNDIELKDEIYKKVQINKRRIYKRNEAGNWVKV